MDIITIFVVFFLGIAVSFIGVIVGGGGLISIPILIFLGLPPQIAIATNKFGSLGLSLSGLYKYWKAKKIIFEFVAPLTVIGLLGSYLGANLLLQVSDAILSKVVGIIIIPILLLVLFGGMGIKKKEKITIKRKYTGYILYLFVAFWGGFFGGGAGIFATYVFISVFNLTFIESAATDQIPWLAISITALIVFAINSRIEYIYGIILLLGMLIGAYVGSHIAINKGNRWVRSLFMIIVIASSLKLLFF